MRAIHSLLETLVLMNILKDYLSGYSTRPTDADAQALVKSRCSYDYPKAYLARSSTITEIQLAPKLWATPVHPVRGQVTDQWLDNYHYTLLHSSDPIDNLLGTASVVFWGFYTFSPKYAEARVMRHLYDNKIHRKGASPH